jgi:hypothetical protein
MNHIVKSLATVAAALASLLVLPKSGQAAEVYASTVTNLLRGSAPGDFFPDYYGGSLSGSWPMVLDTATAQASILGAPDDRFLTLPGVGAQPPGTAFLGAYAEMSFGMNFGANTELRIYEVGNNAESAAVWLWFADGGFLQLSATKGSDPVIVLDLSPYAGLLASHGGAFTKVGIGGMDELGASKGFDLDGVSIQAVPEPQTYALMAGGLGVLGFIARRRRPV